MPDYVPGTEVVINQSKWMDVVNTMVVEIIKKMPPTPNNCDGGLYVGNAGVAYMLYYLASKTPFADNKAKLLSSASEYISVSMEFVKSGRRNDPGPSFILGPAGVYAVATIILNALGEQNTGGKELCQKRYIAYANESLNLRFPNSGSDELFVGRAGYLCGIMNLQKKLGTKVIHDDVTKDLCAKIVRTGRDYARSHKSGSPLMYEYYHTEYLGAAHGLSSILQMLLSFPVYLESDRAAEQDIRGAVDFMLSLEQPNHNFPPAMDEVSSKSRRPESEELIHWCHGAPGVIYLFARAYKWWGDPKYLEACVRCGEVIWQYGLLRKGPGICHGIAGNGYAFLLLYRLTNDKKYLHRAQQFAEFMFTEEFLTRARVPDAPYSLYEGRAGTVCFLADLLQPENAEFPFFDVF